MYSFNIDIISYNTFKELLAVVSTFKGFLGEICNDARTEFCKKPTDKKPDLALSYILSDITMCYKQLKYSLSVNTYEGQCFMLTFICLRDYTIEFNDLIYLVTSDERFSRNGFLRKTIFENISQISKNANISNESNYLLLNKLQFDYELQSKYLALLYNYMLLVVKSDHLITDEEKQWLDNLRQKRESISEPSTQNCRGNVTNVNNSTQNTQNIVYQEDPFKDLSDLIGLSSVKTEINNLSNLVKMQKMRESRGIKTSSVSYHCVFTGNPGTGKTTVARIVAEIYKQLGVLKKGHLIETDRSGLVAEYVGQTAPKTNAIIDSALDGVLFIDEAYSLIQGGNSDYGKEAIATLLKRMEDNRDRLVVILAGYTKEMRDFINSNSGLQSRFNRYIEFPDYNSDELMRIFEYTAGKNEFVVSERAKAKIREVIQEEESHKDQNFGNARFVRNLFEKIITEQAGRLTKEENITNEKLTKIEEEDVVAVLSYYFKREYINDSDINNSQDTTREISEEKGWDLLIKNWTEKGWYYDVLDDGFFVRLEEDIRIDFGYYQGHYYMQARYKEDCDFSTQMKNEYRGRRNYGSWWKFLDEPFFDMERGSFMKTLEINDALQKYVDYWVNKLMQNLMNYHINQTITS